MFWQRIQILQTQGPESQHNRQPHHHTVQAAACVQLDKVIDQLSYRAKVTIFFKDNLTELHRSTSLASNLITPRCKIPSTIFLASEFSSLSLGTQYTEALASEMQPPTRPPLHEPIIPSLHYFCCRCCTLSSPKTLLAAMSLHTQISTIIHLQLGIGRVLTNQHANCPAPSSTQPARWSYGGGSQCRLGCWRAELVGRGVGTWLFSQSVLIDLGWL